MLDAGVCIFKMMIIGRDTCDRYGVKDDDIAYTVLRAKQAYVVIENLAKTLNDYKGITQRFAVMGMVCHSSTQTDTVVCHNKGMQTWRLRSRIGAPVTAETGIQSIEIETKDGSVLPAK